VVQKPRSWEDTADQELNAFAITAPSETSIKKCAERCAVLIAEGATVGFCADILDESVGARLLVRVRARGKLV
jgi:hypothetical protein